MKCSTCSAVGLAALGGVALAAPAHAATMPTAKVHYVVLASHPGHPEARDPYYAVFSTVGPLEPRSGSAGRRGERVGSVGIDGPASMPVYYVADPGRHSGHLWCYAAAASSRVVHRLGPGKTVPVQIALNADDSAPRYTRDRKIRTRTLQDAAMALGCNDDRTLHVGDRVRVRSGQVLVREDPAKSYVGSLLPGQSFRVLRLSPSGKNAYGVAYGHLNRKLWVRTADLLGH